MGERFLIFIFIFLSIMGVILGPYLWKKAAISNSQNSSKTEKQIDENTTSTQEENPTGISTIRVLLSNQKLGSYMHRMVTITSDLDYYVTCDGKSEKRKAGTETKVTFRWGKKGKMLIFSGPGKLSITSLRRSYGIPSYRGKIEVHYTKKGLYLVNELLLEEYLYSVVPSEMPISYGLEALKVQAVCARSFALRQKMGKKFKKYGADVDDSVSSQVYNNTKESKLSIRAVQETAGFVASFQNKIITTYFFSTSWGHTADSHDVWLQRGDSPVYLTGKLQNNSQKKLDLSNENKIISFLNKKVDTYDSKMPWYRWKVMILKVSLNHKNIGSIRKVTVSRRGKSGVAKQLCITGSGGVKVIQGEYQIRKYLNPKKSKIIRQDGSRVRLSLLPSGCFYIKEGKNYLSIYGGGFGHGVGMSQNGVKKQVELGKNYQEILKFYYPGIEIKNSRECE